MLDKLPLSQLSLPQATRDDFFVEHVVGQHASQVLSLFCERYADRLEPHGNLLSLLSSAAPSLDLETAWDPAFGGIHALMVRGLATGVEERAAAVALRLHERSHEGSWSAPLSNTTHLHFDRWPLPACERIRVEVDGSQARIWTTSAGKEQLFRFSRTGLGWRAEQASPTLHEARVAPLRLLIWRKHEFWSEEVADVASAVDDSQPDLMAKRCEAAAVILRECSPKYFGWVVGVLRFVAPWRVLSTDRPTGSSSTNFAPGLIGVGNDEHPFSLADSLVHEASHHHFYIALRLGAVHDGTDTQLYYNPFLDLQRPIDRILLSYHAFANVLLFCQELRSCGASGRDYLDRRIPQLKDGVRVLDQALESTRSLTTVGQALWRYLRQAVHEQTRSPEFVETSK